ncbi:hypothetical protein [Pseudomonas sp. NPDC087690]|uniref:hypothetical protein n=1 Tax=Pseudomonas sp. NPDC087690 TaxID=3364446 RepID=UPI00382159EF
MGLSKDLIVWFGCVLLVFVGVLIGQAPLGTDFFKASNIHDFFDIVGVIATCAAVIVAASGLNTWKSQVKSTADHELARRMAISLEKYKTEVNNVWADARIAASLVLDEERVEGKLAEMIVERFSGSLNKLNSSRGELKAVALECKAMWDVLLEKDLNALFIFSSICEGCVSSCIRFVSPTSNALSVASAKGTFDMNWKKIDFGPEANSDQATLRIENMFSPISSLLGVKLLR